MKDILSVASIICLLALASGCQSAYGPTLSQMVLGVQQPGHENTAKTADPILPELEELSGRIERNQTEISALSNYTEKHAQNHAQAIQANAADIREVSAALRITDGKMEMMLDIAGDMEKTLRNLSSTMTTPVPPIQQSTNTALP